MKIGLFDSGIGGLNVLSEFLKKYPNNIYYYYGDTKNVPYGDKDKNTLFELSKRIIHCFEEKEVDLIIIACGTVSASCYQELKELTSIPILDIISPTINYINRQSFSKVLVFATNRTINSHIFRERLNKKTIEVSTPEFVPMIENRCIDPSIIKKYIAYENDIDALVLGCTHYPLLINYLNEFLPDNVTLINMGKCLVDDINITNNTKQEIHLFFSKIDDLLKKNIEYIIPFNYTLDEE